LDTSYQIKKTLPDASLSNLSRNLNSLATISRLLYLYEDAVFYQSEALKIGEESGDESTYLRALSGLASLYKDLDEEDKSFETDLLLHRKAKALDDGEAIGVSARNIGIRYRELMQMDSALFYFKISEEKFKKIGYKRGLSEVSVSFGSWYFENKQYDKSEEYFKRGYTYANEIEDNNLKARNGLELGLLYLEQKKFNSSKKFILEGLELYQNLEYDLGVKDCYEGLGAYYEEVGDWENAFKYQGLHFSLADSLGKEKYNKEVKTLEIKYETEIKDVKIDKQKLIIISQKNKEKVLGRYLGLISLLGLSGIFILFQRVRKNRIISEKNIEIKNQNIVKLEKENKILALSSMLEGQESERKRIAQDLHDGLGGILTTVRVQIKNIHKEIGKLQDINLVDQTEKLIDQAYFEVRRISHDMMPGALVNLGLFAAVEDLADQINRAEEVLVKTQWYTDEENIPEKTKIILYRIIQEATTNTLKYAKASQLIIQMTQSAEAYNLTIEDDGVGFDLESIDLNKSVGLKSIKSRVQYLNGEIDIRTSPNKGTSYEIEIPINL